MIANSLEHIKNILNQFPHYKKFLFNRGYVISDKPFNENNDFPFYDNFNFNHLCGYYFAIHKNQHFYFTQQQKTTVFLIGNCINPFKDIFDENIIVEEIAKLVCGDFEKFIDYINELTGDFLLGYIFNDKLFFITDPAGMLFCVYGVINGRFFLSSHAQLVCDISPLKKSDYINKLEKYKYFYKYGLFFAGDLTQYCDLKRALQNHIMSFDGKNINFQRFYPTKELQLCQSEDEYKKIIIQTMQILTATIKLLAEKYKNPAISLTGGMDSKTTLAAANGQYEKFFLYSYITMEGDKQDAFAAHSIAEHLGINHTIFEISDNDKDFNDIEVVKTILRHNNGNYNLNSNDIRKRYYLAEQNDFDIEIKSWVSEIARANYYKKFGLKKMPKHLSARNMTSMYKIFTWQRGLVKQTDKVFKEFIKKTRFNELPNGYDESDMYLWEFRYSAWGGMVITSEHSYSTEICVPFNNRKLLDIMLRAPKDKRISDQFHRDLISYGNLNISETGINITNWNETKNRMRIERLYFLINSYLPF